MARPRNVEEWLVEGLLRPGALGVIAAPVGLGKSWVRTELGMRVAAGTGSLFASYRVAKQANVLVVDEENGALEEWRRDEVMLNRLGLERAGLPYWRASHAGILLDQPYGQEWLTAEIDRNAIGLVLLDAISSMHTAREIREELLPIHHFLRSLMSARPGLTIVLIHHLKKQAATARGTDRVLEDLRGGLWHQVADLVAMMAPLSGGRVRWTLHKRVAPHGIVLEPASDGPLDFVKAVTAAEPTNRDLVLAAIRGGATTLHDVMTETRLAERTVYKWLEDLREAGVVAAGVPLRPAEDGESI